MDVSSFLKALDTQQIIEKAKDIASKAKTKIKSIAPQRNENEVDLSLESIIVEGSTDSERTAIVRKVFQHSLAQNIPGVSVEQKLEVSKARILTLPNYRTCEIGVETLPRPSRIRFWSPHPRVLRIKLTESGWRQGRIFVGIEGGKPVGQLSLSTWNRLPGHRTLRAVGSMAPRTGESQDFGLLQYTNPTPPPGLPAVTLQLGHHNTHHGEPALAHSLATTHCEAALTSGILSQMCGSSSGTRLGGWRGLRHHCSGDLPASGCVAQCQAGGCAGAAWLPPGGAGGLGQPGCSQTEDQLLGWPTSG
eukprot:gnl/Dysnectes_brevis/2801_a3415_814.p1 GENE.gnl/Dysnectes_brevis/2801_a3415_814~~gnl/Dysnectes_brevis/2801_a3415_814.p1  ORF type:complete len:305 (-),score=56.00 gnl/Dysnectes_brevis/2801_a3415_814:132-1046(-)